MSKLLDSLNPEQREVAATIHGPLLVLAGAGSGKTRALTHRLAYMVEQKLAAPEEILAVTFTNKAAKEMKQRVMELLGPSHTTPGTIGTFHGLGARLLREMAQYHNRPRTFTILDAKDSEKLLKEAMQRVGISPKQMNVKSVRSRISLAKNNMRTATDLAASDSPIDQDVSRIFAAYEKLLLSHEAYDFDDLLLVPIGLLQRYPDVAKAYQQRWRFLSVDEYQDTNPPQEELLRLLMGPEKNICVVGDDYQAIYSWRGANVDHILRFEKRYPNCKVIYLTQNYRSTPAILGAANKVIAVNKEQKHKKLWTERGAGELIALAQVQSERHEATFIRQQIEAWRQDGGALRDCVVLYRTNAQSRVFEEEFLKHRLPYTIVGGFKFYERREIKDALAFLTLWLNPGSALALRRLMESYVEGVGKRTVQGWADEAESTGKPILHVLQAKGSAKPGLAKFLQAFVGAGEGNHDGTAADVLSHLLTKSGYFQYLRQEPDGQERMENIQELVNVTALYTDLAAFLEEVALLADLDAVDAKSDRITCMSIHAAKGLEFPVVFLAGLEEGLLPHINSLADPAALEEERRLLYVAMTRAKEKLVLTYTRARLLRGESTMQIPSRFLRDLPKEMMQEVILGEQQPSTYAGSWLDPVLDEETSQLIDHDERPELRVNDFIRHGVLGKGVVIGTQGDKVTCVFEQHGVQAVPWREIEKLPELHFN